MKQTEFQWIDEDRGQEIEEFLLMLCEAVPGVAMEILAIGFGDLRTWFNGRSTWKNAKCGCLVGTFAVVGRDMVPGCVQLAETHPDDLDDNDGATGALYMAIAAATKRNIHAYESVSRDPLYRLINNVGVMVGEECNVWNWDSSITRDKQERTRTQDVGQYLLDFMRMALTSMGYSRLPTSPEIPCRLAR
jgi:hypothetical protein